MNDQQPKESKTAEEFLEEMSFDVKHPTGLYLDRNYVIQAMQAYARQYVREAAECAEVMGIEEFDYMQYVVDKNSIPSITRQN